MCELSEKSPLFCELWARQDVVRPAGGPVLLHHPKVGDLILHREKLVVSRRAGQVLVVYHADGGTPSAERLARPGRPTSVPAITQGLRTGRAAGAAPWSP